MSFDEDATSGGLLDALQSRGFRAAMSAPLVGGDDAPDEEENGIDLGREVLDAKTPEEKYEALKRKHQINLSSPDQLTKSGLEDAALVLHTATRRVDLSELEKTLSELPTEDVIEQEDVKARRALSSLVTFLEELRQQIDCESCALFGFASKADTPLNKQLRSSATQLEAVVSSIHQAQASLTIARRSSEMALEGRKARAAHFKAAVERYHP